MEADKQGVDALEDKLAAMEGLLRDIRTDVSWILTAVRDELEAIRQREFWQEPGSEYQSKRK
jgi:hypothetical protein